MFSKLVCVWRLSQAFIPNLLSVAFVFSVHHYSFSAVQLQSNRIPFDTLAFPPAESKCCSAMLLWLIKRIAITIQSAATLVAFTIFLNSAFCISRILSPSTTVYLTARLNKHEHFIHLGLSYGMVDPTDISSLICAASTDLQHWFLNFHI